MVDVGDWASVRNCGQYAPDLGRDQSCNRFWWESKGARRQHPWRDFEQGLGVDLGLNASAET